MLSTSAPNCAFNRSEKRKSLWTPKFTPQVPGPHNIFRLATLAWVKTSAPTEGNPNAAGFQIWSPVFWLKLLLSTTGRKDGSAPKSPTASSEEMPMLPGSTGLQSSQIQKGVKPVPDLANILNVVCQPPTIASAHRDIEAPYWRPRPTGKS